LIADLLEKPFTIEELAQKVREALDARVIALT
jgi:DNA-binding response OmpR family regulator